MFVYSKITSTTTIGIKRRLCIVQQQQQQKQLYNNINQYNNNKNRLQQQQQSSFSYLKYYSTVYSQQQQQQHHHHVLYNTTKFNQYNDNIRDDDNEITTPTTTTTTKGIRLSKLVAACVTNPTISRREAERLIRNGKVSISLLSTTPTGSSTGKTNNKKNSNTNIVYTTPQQLIDIKDFENQTAFVLVNTKRYTIPYDLIIDSLSESSSFDSESSLSIARNSNSLVPRVWIMNKNMGELVTENDPRQRPTIYDRIRKLNLLNTNTVLSKNNNTNTNTNNNTTNKHIISIGRLDYNTEGLLLLTTNGIYSRQMELPYNEIHRTYRVRVHGKITINKIKQIQRGAIVPIPITKSNNNNSHLSNTAKTKLRLVAKNNNNNNNNNKRRNGSIGAIKSTTASVQMMKYKPMIVTIDNNSTDDTTARKRIRPSPTINSRTAKNSTTSTNQWVKVTCTEGKNRQIRNVFAGLGLTVTRLIRISYGDYQLQTIPPGAILEVPYKSFDNQRNKGPLQFPTTSNNSSVVTTGSSSTYNTSTTGNVRIGKHRNDNSTNNAASSTTRTRSRRNGNNNTTNYNNNNNNKNHDDDSYRSPIQWIRNHH